MSGFEIRPAVRKGTPALIGLWGPSGTGKTYSALLMARGLVGPGGKIGLIDTENRRAEFYAKLADGWDHLDLQPPFSPQRYTQAFAAFEKAGGYGCIIVDSMSHVWEGEGGVLDMADSATTARGEPLTGLAKWNKPKREYKRMLNALLRAPFHVIFCLRAKEKSEQRGKGPNAEIVNVGWVPIAEKGFKYEMTVDARLDGDHVPQDLKCPEELLDAFPRGRQITTETGAEIARWVGEGAEWDAEQAVLEREARDQASRGHQSMQAYWNDLGRAKQRLLKPILDELRLIAREADETGIPIEEEEDLENAFAEPDPVSMADDPLDGPAPAEQTVPPRFQVATLAGPLPDAYTADDFVASLSAQWSELGPEDRVELWNLNKAEAGRVMALGFPELSEPLEAMQAVALQSSKQKAMAL